MPLAPRRSYPSPPEAQDPPATLPWETVAATPPILACSSHLIHHISRVPHPHPGRIRPASYAEDDEDGASTPHEGVMLRVWPGGINMTRTLGDAAAEGLLIPEPAVRQVRCGRPGDAAGTLGDELGPRWPCSSAPLPAVLPFTHSTEWWSGCRRSRRSLVMEAVLASRRLSTRTAVGIVLHPASCPGPAGVAACDGRPPHHRQRRPVGRRQRKDHHRAGEGWPMPVRTGETELPK